MSSMLEQAIIDATALKEAALKNAEAALIEKYAPEIKNAVDSLLEQELGIEATAEMEQEAVVEAENQIDAPAAFLEGMADNPEDGESVEITLTLEALQEMAEELLTDEDDTTEILDEEELEEAELSSKQKKIAAKAPPKNKITGADFEALRKESTDEEVILDEEGIAALVEELVVDIKPVKTGWAGTPESTLNYDLELELAHRASTEARKENEALKKAIAELSESKEHLESTNGVLKETVMKMKSAFDEMSLSNAKLLYTNRILSSPSLNERQKETVVEAISKAGSVNEAKVIFETLQSTGGAPSKKAMPQSLSEAIQRSSSTVLPRRQPERKADTAINRLQILAGIKNK